jgi:hypothetical protein
MILFIVELFSFITKVLLLLLFFVPLIVSSGSRVLINRTLCVRSFFEFSTNNDVPRIGGYTYTTGK